MTAVIEVTGLTKRYGGRAVVDGISFHVDQGEIFGILGPNGAGKTTAVECLEGLRRRDGGEVRILGLDPRTGAHRLHQRIGVQLQETQLPEKLKVREALELYASFYPDPADWRELLSRWGLTDKDGTSFAKLSGGQKQRLFIALALVGNPEVVFLDELTAGLDPGARRATWDLISQVRAQGVTVVLATCSRTLRLRSCCAACAPRLAARPCSRPRSPPGCSARSGSRQGAAQPARARHPRPDRPWLLQPGGRQPLVHQRGHGQDPPAAHLRQARRQRPRRRRGDRL